MRWIPSTRVERLTHFVVDELACIVLSVAALILLLPGPASADGIVSRFTGPSAAVSVAIVLLVHALYYVLLEAATGRTLGKLITRTRVVTPSGGKPGPLAVILRTIYRIMPLEPLSGFFGDGADWWHDRWSGTCVVSLRESTAGDQAGAADARGGPLLALGAHPLSLAEAFVLALGGAIGIGAVYRIVNAMMNRGLWGAASDDWLFLVGGILSIIVGAMWVKSNRAEATPNEDQLVEMRRFVNDHFAKYVAHGLAAEGIGPIAVSQDSAWRKVYLQHLRLHNELYAFRQDIALRLFVDEIDDAVRRELAALQATGQHANPAVATT